MVADRSGSKKRLLGAFVLLGAFACMAMFFIRPGDWQLAGGLFLLANLGASASFVFYDALLPHVAREGEVDRLSTSAFAASRAAWNGAGSTWNILAPFSSGSRSS